MAEATVASVYDCLYVTLAEREASINTSWPSLARSHASLQCGDPQSGNVLVGGLVKVRRSGRIVRITGRDVDDHSLPCPGEEDAVGVEEIAAIFGAGDIA